MLFEDHIDLFADLNISGQVKSIVSGVSPMVVTSRILNINFNADLLDDEEGSYYLDFQNFTGRAAFSQLPQISPGLIGRYSTGTGDIQHVTLGAGFSLPGGVLTYTETDPTVPAHVKGITSGDITNWNTAYGWGDFRNYGLDTPVLHPSYADLSTLGNFTGFARTGNAGSDFPPGAGASSFVIQHHHMSGTSSRGHQIVLSYSVDRMFFRRKVDGVYQDWREVVHSSNLSSIGSGLFVNTTGNQSGIAGNKQWTGGHRWTFPANANLVGEARSIQVGANTNGPVVVGFDNNGDQTFTLRTYATTDIQLALNAGGISTPNHGTSADWYSAYANSHPALSITGQNYITLNAVTQQLTVGAISLNSSHTSGLLPVTKGGTGLSSLGSSGQFLRVNGAGNALEYYSLPSPVVPDLQSVTDQGAVTSNDITVEKAGPTSSITVRESTSGAYSVMGAYSSGAEIGAVHTTFAAGFLASPSDASLNFTNFASFDQWSLQYISDSVATLGIGDQLRVQQDPVHNNDLARKAYVDSLVAAIPGTVTSVSSGNLSGLFTTLVSNATSTPSISFTLSDQLAYTVFARGSGNGEPSFQTLTADHIPDLNASKITTGVLPVARGGTGAGTLTGILVGNGTSPITSITGSSDQLLRRNTANTGYEFFTHDFISSTLIGANNGIAPLDATGKIPSGYLPVTGMQYKGTWDASTNTPTLSDATGQDGWYYRVTAAGTQNLGSGNITFSVGDDIIHNGVSWERAPSGVAATNLAVGTRTNTSLPITNSNGTGFSIPLATGSLAGIISGDDYTKLQNAITENQTITVSGAVNGSGTTSIVTTFRNSAALSVIGRSANSVGAPSDITAVTDGHVLRRSGTSLGFGLIGDNSISSLSWSKLSSVPTTLSGYGIQTEADNRYVNITGDTMTGTLTVKSSIGYKLNLINTQDISSAVDLSFRNPTGDEWQIIAANTGNTTFGDVDFWVNSLLINGEPIATEDWVESKGYITSASIPSAQTLSFDSGTGSLSISSGNSVSLDDRYLSLKPSSHTLSNNASLDIDTISGTSILRVEPIVGGVPAGAIMTWDAGERKYQFHHSHFSGDSVFYRNQLTTAGGWRAWYQVASREWADSTFYTKTISDGRYVNTYGNQSGIAGNKTWTGGHIWAPGSNFTPASAPATIAIGKSTSGIYLIAYDNDSNQAFALRTYTATGGIQLTLDKGGISTPIHGDSAQWNTAYTMRHDAVTITGQNYLSLSGQQITAGAIALNAGHVTGTLPVNKGGTGLGTIGTAGQLLKVNSGGTGLEYFTPSYLTSADLSGYVPNTRTISTTNGLQGGGALTGNLTLSPVYGTTSNTVAEGNHNHDSRYLSIVQNGAILTNNASLDIDAITGTSILRAEPIVGGVGSGVVMTWDAGGRAYQIHHSHSSSDALYYRNQLTIAGGWRAWYQVASREWTTNTFYSKTESDGKYVPQTRTLQFTNGAGLTVSGTASTDLSVNRTVTYSVNFGTTAGTVAQGNDSRINNGQTAYGWGNHASAGYVPQTRELIFGTGDGLLVSGTSSTNLSVNRTVNYAVNFGTGVNQVARGNHNHDGVYVPTSRTITINGVTHNLSDNRSWTISAGVTGSGSNGYIARWNSGTGITNSELYQSGSNIGIGTTSPADKLTINGTLGVTGDAAVRGTALHVHNNLSIGKYDSVPGNRAHGSLLVHSGDTSTYAHVSAALEIRSTTKALLLPRQSTTQWDNIGSKPEGLFSYDTTDKSIRWFTGTETIKLFANSLGFWVFVGGIYRRINFDL